MFFQHACDRVDFKRIVRGALMWGRQAQYHMCATQHNMRMRRPAAFELIESLSELSLELTFELRRIRSLARSSQGLEHLCSTSASDLILRILNIQPSNTTHHIRHSRYHIGLQARLRRIRFGSCALCERGKRKGDLDK